MSQTVNFKWPQGEDLEISLIYKEGPSETSALAVDLSSTYEARMDIVLPATKAVLVSLESVDDEISLSTGLNKSPNINIWLDRQFTLPAGPANDPPAGVLYTNLATTTNFNYDLFLRNTSTDHQVKVLRGQLNIERSNTLWV